MLCPNSQPMSALKISKVCECRNTSSSIAEIGSSYIYGPIRSFLHSKIVDSGIIIPTHAYIITTGQTQNVFIASKLIESYASINRIRSAAKVFDHICFKDSFLWNSIIKAYFSHGNYWYALELLSNMLLSGTLPNQFTIPMVTSSCAELGFLSVGMNVHGLVSKMNLFCHNLAIGSSFIYLYSKCGFVKDARLMFDEILMKDVVAWTALVVGYVQNGESEKGLACLCEMHLIGGYSERPNFRTLEGGFQACGDLNALVEGMCLHGFALKSGIVSSHIIQSDIVSMYSKCGSIEDAQALFSEMSNKDLFSWTSIIGVYARAGCVQECFQMFLRMQAEGVSPDGMLISCVLCGFSNSMKVLEGKAFHGFILRQNYEDGIVDDALLLMYCKFGLLSSAEKIFDEGHVWEKDSWNSMIIGYEKAGFEINCMKLFGEMQHQGVESDFNSLISVISSCSRLEAIRLGQSIHCHVMKNSMFEHVSVMNSLINMYGKCGDLTKAHRLFNQSQQDLAAWNSVLSSYTQSGNSLAALNSFDKMISTGLQPNTATIVTLLSACGQIASAEKGSEIHKYIRKQGLGDNVVIATALIDMYSKCGLIKMAREIFDSMNERDVISWNVMISCYGMHGIGKSAIDIFHQMEQTNVRPNDVTVLAVLNACAQAGLVYEGKALFKKMKEQGFVPTLKHYTCMVDLLGKSGNLEEAEALILSMPFCPDGGLWGSLLTSCKMHNNTHMGIKIAKHAIRTDPENDGYYVLISDLFGSVGMWEEVERVRMIMKDRGLKKTLGWSAL